MRSARGYASRGKINKALSMVHLLSMIIIKTMINVRLVFLLEKLRSICYLLKSKRENASFTLTRLPSIIPLRLYWLREYVQCILKQEQCEISTWVLYNQQSYLQNAKICSASTQISLPFHKFKHSVQRSCATSFLGADLDISLSNVNSKFAKLFIRKWKCIAFTCTQ